METDWAEDFVRRVSQATGERLSQEAISIFSDELRARAGEPDDGELVTEEWLRSVGFTQIDEDAFAIDIWRARTCSMDGPDECGTSLVWSCNECWILDLYDIDKRGKGGWAGVDTRREVRRLCQALGIALLAAPAEGGG